MVVYLYFDKISRKVDRREKQRKRKRRERGEGEEGRFESAWFSSQRIRGTERGFGAPATPRHYSGGEEDGERKEGKERERGEGNLHFVSRRLVFISADSQY